MQVIFGKEDVIVKVAGKKLSISYSNIENKAAICFFESNKSYLSEDTIYHSNNILSYYLNPCFNMVQDIADIIVEYNPKEVYLIGVTNHFNLYFNGYLEQRENPLLGKSYKGFSKLVADLLIERFKKVSFFIKSASLSYEFKCKVSYWSIFIFSALVCFIRFISIYGSHKTEKLPNRNIEKICIARNFHQYRLLWMKRKHEAVNIVLFPSFEKLKLDDSAYVLPFYYFVEAYIKALFHHLFAKKNEQENILNEYLKKSIRVNFQFVLHRELISVLIRHYRIKSLVSLEQVSPQAAIEGLVCKRFDVESISYQSTVIEPKSYPLFNPFDVFYIIDDKLYEDQLARGVTGLSRSESISLKYLTKLAEDRRLKSFDRRSAKCSIGFISQPIDIKKRNDIVHKLSSIAEKNDFNLMVFLHPRDSIVEYENLGIKAEYYQPSLNTYELMLKCSHIFYRNSSLAYDAILLGIDVRQVWVDNRDLLDLQRLGSYGSAISIFELESFFANRGAN